MNVVEKQPSGWFVWRWVVLCGLGLGAGLGAGLALAAPIETVVGMMLVTPITLAIAGTVLGAGQWLAMWNSPRTGLVWVAVTALGLGLGMTVGIVVVETAGRALTGEQVRLFNIGALGRFISLAVVGAFAGAAVGLAQGVVLRKRLLGAWRWALWCTVGFAAALPLAGAVAGLLPGGLRSPLGFATFLGAAGIGIGALTAGAARDVAAARWTPEERT
jgi:hypothetical protein